ncbi:hypothetical protein D3C77_688050 [compost metagenome]
MRQFVQCLTYLFLLVRWADQSIEGQIALQLVEVDQLLQTLAQRGLTLEQLLLIVGAHEEKLAGRLIAGDARDGLRFVGQMLWCADPLADVILALQLHQTAHTEGDQ